MAITLDGMTRQKSVTTNALSASIAVGTVVETDTGSEESFFIPINLGATDPASFTVASVTTTSGSPTITTTGGGFVNVKVGDVLSGTGVAASQTVQSKSVDNNTITMSANATASGTITLTVDPPSGTPAIVALRIQISKSGSSLQMIPTFYTYNGSLGSVVAASPTNATKTIRLVGTQNEPLSIDLDEFLTNYRVPKSA